MNDPVWTRDYIIYNRSKTASLNLRPFYVGKHQAAGTNDSYFPFLGQPSLMRQIRFAIDEYAAHLIYLNGLGTYLGSFLNFLTERVAKEIELNFIDQNVLNEHALWLNKRGVSQTSRVSQHALGNGVFRRVHATLSEHSAGDYLNLCQPGTIIPIRYPKLKYTKAAQTIERSKYLPTNMLVDIKAYCIDLLNTMDEVNPFLEIIPVFGDDKTNKAHVLFDYLSFHKKKILAGQVDGRWLVQPPLLFPWKSIPFGKTSDIHRTPGELACGGYVNDMHTALFPGIDELMATLFLTTAETGFTDGAKQIGVSPFVPSARHPDRPASSELVQLLPGEFGDRPKTGRNYRSRAVSTGKGGAFWALQRYLKRSVRLRKLGEQRLEILNQEFAAYKDSSSASYREYESEIATLETALRRTLIYFTSKGAKILTAQDISNCSFTTFLTKISPDSNATFYDLRHKYAEKVLAETGSVFEVQAALGHANIMTTMQYLRSRSIREDAFKSAARVAGIVYDEIAQSYEINVDVIRQRFHRGGQDLSDEERAKYPVTAVGARCTNGRAPPNSMDPKNTAVGPMGCTSGNCILCPNSLWNGAEAGFDFLAADEIARLQKDLKIQRNAEKRLWLEYQMEAWSALFSQIPDEARGNIYRMIDKATSDAR